MLLSTAAVYSGCLDGSIWQPFDVASRPVPAVLRGLPAGQVEAGAAEATAVADATATLPSQQPRNYHVVPPSLLRCPISRARAAQEQLLSFSSSHPDAFVPHDVLLPLLLEDMSADSVRAARMLAGNRLAACLAPVSHTLDGQQVPQQLVFSCCGQIGDVLSLAVVTPVQAADKRHSILQISTATELALGQEILQLDVQPIHGGDGRLNQRLQQQTAHGSPASSGVVLVIARSSTRIDAIWAEPACIQGQHWRLEWRASLHTPVPAAHAVLHPKLAEFVVLLQDGCLAVCSLSVALAVSAQQLTAPMPLACSCLMDQQLVAQVLQASGVGPQHNPSAHMLHMACSWGYHPRSIIMSLQGRLWQCDICVNANGLPTVQPKPIHQLSDGETFIALAPAQCTTLLPPRRQLLSHRGAAGSQAQDAQQQPACGPTAVQVAAHSQVGQSAALQPYLAALTSSQVLLLDLRRPHGWVLAAPHGCAAEMPTWLNFTCMPWSRHVNSRSAGLPDTAPSHLQGSHEHSAAVQHVHTTDTDDRSPLLDTQASQAQDMQGPGLSGSASKGGVPASTPAQLQPPCNAMLTWGCPTGQVYNWALSIQRGGTELMLAPLRPTGRAAGSSSSSRQTGHQLSVLLRRTTAVSYLDPARTGTGLCGAPGARAGVHGLSDSLQVWQPACLDTVHAVLGPRQVCPAGSFSAQSRQMWRHSHSTLRPRASSTRSLEAKKWGSQGDADVQRADSLQAQLETARDAPDLAGIMVMPLLDAEQQQQQQGGCLLVRASYDGDLAMQHMCRLAVDARQDTKAMLYAMHSAANAPVQTCRAAVQSKVDAVQQQLGSRYTSSRHAARIIMGSQMLRLRISSKLPRLHNHLHHLMRHGCTAAFCATPQPASLSARQLQGPNRRHTWHLTAAATSTAYVQHQVVSVPLPRPSTSATGSAPGAALQEHWLPWLHQLMVAMHTPLTTGDVMLRIPPAYLSIPSQVQHRLATGVCSTCLPPRGTSRSKSHVEQLLKVRLSGSSQLLRLWAQRAEDNACNISGSAQHTQHLGRCKDSTPDWDGTLLAWCCSQQGEQLVRQLAAYVSNPKAVRSLPQNRAPIGAHASKQQCEDDVAQPHVVLSSGMPVRLPAASAASDPAAATAATALLPACNASHSVLQVHLQVVVPRQQLQPCSSQVLRYVGVDHPAAPVLQRAAQVRRQGQPAGAWQLALSSAALKCYHSLLDAWSGQPSTSRTNEAGDAGDAPFFVLGYQDSPDEEVLPGNVQHDKRPVPALVTAAAAEDVGMALHQQQAVAVPAQTSQPIMQQQEMPSHAAAAVSPSMHRQTRKRKVQALSEGF